MSLRNGSTVMHYRIERRLGAGGMGEVYLAQDTKLHRQVAIKFLSAPDDEHARRRLLREARAAAGLDHPGVCAVYEVGTDPARGDFVVMQYVEGEALSDRLRRGRLEPTEALQVAERIAEALMAAHDRGIVHRDLKPQNIIITPSGRPKLLDFGLAKRALTSAAAAEAPTTAAITRPYAMLGTPGYMAPEQIRNGRVDRRADVFALGCVLYECLTGQRAFPGPTPPDMLGQVLHTDPPPVSSVVPGVGEGVDALCARLLRKDVKERCQSAEEALGAIRALLPPGTADSETRRRSSRTSSIYWRLAAGVVLVIVAAVGATIGVVEWRHRHRLPTPSADAQKWFDRGVEALREGAYAGARASLEEAIRLDPQFAQAYARLADAESELDDERGAQAALLRIGELVPDQTALSADEQVRLEAVRAAVLREHDQSITSYRQLANARPGDATGWLDLGRAQEAAGRLADARDSYAKAVQVDGQYAAGYLRLGSIQGTPTAKALSLLEEAVRLDGIATNTEGEAEALLRKGVLLNSVGQYDKAREALDQVMQLTTDPRYVSQRFRSEFELARTTAFGGHFAEAETLGRKAVDEATAADSQSLAANGLVDLAGTLMLAGKYDDAEGLFVRAISLAASQGSTRIEMRARLQQASLRQATGHPDEAIALCDKPLQFFSIGHYTRLEAIAKTIVARAQGDLEHYEQANRLTSDVLAFAESINDDALAATSLENHVSQMMALGRLPEALADIEQVENIRRTQKDQSALPSDLVRRADLLIRLGRSPEAETVLREVEQGMAAGFESYTSRRPVVTELRVLLASVDRRFSEIAVSTAASTIAPAAPGLDSVALFTRVLVEHARAELGESRVAARELARWPGYTKDPVQSRELAYWVGDTLIARGDGRSAFMVVSTALAAPGGQGNLELHWRLEATAARAVSDAASIDGGSMSSRARADLQRLSDLWRGAATSYLARPDLAALRRTGF